MEVCGGSGVVFGEGEGVREVRRGAVSKPRKYLRGETQQRGRMEKGGE